MKESEKPEFNEHQNIFYQSEDPNPLNLENSKIVFRLAKNNVNISQAILRNKVIYKNTIDKLSNPNYSNLHARHDLRKIKDRVTNQSQKEFMTGIKNN